MNLLRLLSAGSIVMVLAGCGVSVEDDPVVTLPDGGVAGRSGSATSGSSGSAGRSGSAGMTGWQPTSGTTGRPQTSGTAGWPQTSGYAGKSGSPSCSGSLCVTGSTGWAGWSGVSPVTGSTGRTGYSGWPATSGYSGTAGVGGKSGAVWSYCPSTLPSNGQWCGQESEVCRYASPCGADDVAVCVSSGWRVSQSDCTGYCPPTLPSAGSSCSGNWTTCYYPNYYCGGTSTATCVQEMDSYPLPGYLPGGKAYGYWSVSDECSYCPPNAPMIGNRCGGFIQCSYANSCGGSDEYSCSGGTWMQNSSYCASYCPPYIPKEGEFCQGGSSCEWTNTCGMTVYGYCSGGSWMLKDPGCSGACPSQMPANGTYCGGSYQGICSYSQGYPGSYNYQCMCNPAYGWFCGSTTYPVGYDSGPNYYGEAGVTPYFDAGAAVDVGSTGPVVPR